MQRMDLILECNEAFKDHPEPVFLEDPVLRVVRCETGTVSGKSSVMIGFQMPDDGPYVIIQTTLALFKAAAYAMEARDRVEGRPQ